MNLVQHLSVVALRQVLDGACKAVGFLGTEAAVDFLTSHFIDHSQRLTRALHHAHQRAWQALEIALAGESLWSWLDRTEDKALRRQVRAFLDVTPLAGLPGHGPEFRQAALRELRKVRKAKALAAGSLDPRELARQAGAFARFSDPQALLEAEWQAIDQLADDLRRAGYKNLAHLLALRPAQGPSLLAVAVRYFFRRAVETDAELSRGLAWASWESIAAGQQKGFEELDAVLAEHGRQLDEILEVVGEVRDAVLDLRTEIQGQRDQIQHLAHDILEVLAERRLERRELQPGDSLSIRGEEERRLVKDLVARYRALPEQQRKELPALLNAVGKIEVVAGEFEAAQHDFQAVAGLAPDRRARAEAHYNAYLAALERHEDEMALAELRQAVELDADRFAPFPLAKYEPLQILGAGGFGVAFLCRDRHADSRVVVKALRADGLERTVDEVFREARVLEQLEHPAIIRLRYCDYADPGRSRPYLVMDYFEGPTLADYVARHGPLTPADLLLMARPVAEALAAAHDRGILHRDVKPANLLVRRVGAAWQVKLIDFGLALKQGLIPATVNSPALRSRSAYAYSLAGTLDYAAPEQLGKLPHVPVGPHSDVYGFGKTCCYALFQTTQPLFRHWRTLPPSLAELLEHCLAEQPKERPANCAAVLDRLRDDVPLSVLTPTPVPPRPAPVPVVVPAAPVPARESMSFGAILRILVGIALTAAVGTVVGMMGGVSTYGLTARESEYFFAVLVPIAAAAGGLGTVLARGRHRKAGPELLGCLAAVGRLTAGATLGAGLAALGVAVGLLWLRGPVSVIASLAVLGAVLGALWGWAPRCPGAGAVAGLVLVGAVAGAGVVLGSAEAGSLFGLLLGLMAGAFVWFPRPTPEFAEGLALTRARRRRFLRAAGWLAAAGLVLVPALFYFGAWRDPCQTRQLSINQNISQMLLSPDGRQMLTCDQSQNQACLWDARTGRQLNRFQSPVGRITSLAFAADGPLCATEWNYTDQEAKVWNVETGSVRRRVRSQANVTNLGSFTLAAEGRRALSCDQSYPKRTVFLWDLEKENPDPQAQSDQPLQRFTGHTANVGAMALSPDGGRVLTGGGFGDNSVRLWDATTGKEMHNAVKPTSGVRGVALSPSGSLALSFGEDRDGTVWVWDVSKWQSFRPLQGHNARVSAATFSPDGGRVLTGGEDGTVRLWDAKTGEELYCFRRSRSWFLGQASPIRSVAFVPQQAAGEKASGRQRATDEILAASADGTIRFWRLPQLLGKHME